MAKGNAYTSVLPLVAAQPTDPRLLPDWMPEDDAERVAAYGVYEDIYWNVPLVFKLQQRGTEAMPIYVPAARTIVDATHRWVARQLTWKTPKVGSTSDQAGALMWWEEFAKREEFKSKFSTQKRFGLIRGDAVWHVVADDTAVPGRKISLYDVDPARYVRVADPNDVDRTIAAMLVDKTVDEAGKAVIRRQIYIKENGKIRSQLGNFETKQKWWEPGEKPQTTIVDIVLPALITAIPLYHVRNFRAQGWGYGSSELRGYERILAALHQGISDEELALAFDGIGVYATTAGPPTDKDGNVVPWRIGPGRVIEHAAGTDFIRVPGVGSISPFQEHLRFLIEQMKESSGTSDIAVGKVDVSVAQSGIALLLQLGPMLAKAGEKNDLLIDKLNQMAFDIMRGWVPSFEQTDFNEAVLEFEPGEPLPPDRDKRFAEIMQLLAATVVSAAWARKELTSLGYDIPDSVAQEVKDEQAASDPFAALGGGGGLDDAGLPLDAGAPPEPAPVG
jgi:hypothetical protein